MKFCRVLYKEKIRFGKLENERIRLLPDSAKFPELKNDLSSFQENIDFSEVDFLPLITPSKIVCVGRNYAEHAAELGNEVPKEPLLFLKAPSSLILDGENIVIPEQSKRVEHEGELAVIIGRECKNLSDSDDPFEFVFGYTCLNDVTARDLQKKDIQFTRAKSFDTFCPVGNFVETELNVDNLRVTTKVNGEIKQDGNTSQMVFSVPFLIRYISKQMTLNAGDIIATGTPSGVSQMNSGDTVEVEIDGIGVLKNPVK